MRKNRNNILLIFGLLVGTISAIAQPPSFINYTVQASCHGEENGSISVSLDQIILEGLVEVQLPISYKILKPLEEDFEILEFPDQYNFEASGLVAGEYIMIIYFNADCEYQFPFSIFNSSPYFEDPLITITHPSDCTTPDGHFRVINASFYSQYPLNNIRYENFSGDPVFPFPQLLQAGTYYMIGKDSIGCEGKHEIHLYAPYHSEVVMDHQPSCPGGNQGYVAAHLLHGVGAYKYEWQDGFIEINSQEYSERENVASGMYCVTITSMEDSVCVMNGCVVVPEYHPEPLVVNISTWNPCPQQSNGRIIVNTTGGVEPYKITFNDLELNPYILPEGIYIVVVEDKCGALFTQTVSLQAMSASVDDLDIVYGCKGSAGQISISSDKINHGTPPYSNLSTAVNFQWAESPYKDQEFRIRDSRGCELLVGDEPIRVINEFVSIKTEGTCLDLDIGRMLIEINSSKSGIVTLFIDNENRTILVDQNKSNQTIVLDDLPAKSYEIHAYFPNCFYIEQKNIVKFTVLKDSFNRYDAVKDSCIYDEFCVNQQISEESVLKTPILIQDFGGSSGVGSRCQVKRSCPGSNSVIGIIKSGLKTLPLWQYRLLLNDMRLDSRFSGLVAEPNFSIIQEHQNRPCTFVSFCPLSMDIFAVGAKGFGTRSWETSFDSLKNEFSKFCLFAKSNKYNFKNKIDDFFSGEIKVPLNTQKLNGNCIVRKEKVYQLLQWRNEMIIEYPAYTFDSQLSLLLDQYEIWSFQESVSTYCSEIVFCLNDFTVLRSFPFYNHDCSVGVICDTSYIDVNANGDTIVVPPSIQINSYCHITEIEDREFIVCPDKLKSCNESECETFAEVPCKKYTLIRPYVTGMLDRIDETDIIVDRIIPLDNQVLYNRLGYNNSNSHGRIPYAVMNSGAEDQIEFFTEFTTEPFYKQKYKKEMLSVDMDNENTIYSNSSIDKIYEFTVSFGDNELQYSMDASIFLEIDQVLLADSIIYLTGFFEGILSFNNNFVEYSSEKTFFSLQVEIGTSPSFRSMTLVPGSNMTMSDFAILNNPEFYFIDPLKIQELKIDGNSIALDTSALIFNLYQFSLTNTNQASISQSGNLLHFSTFGDKSYSITQNNDLNTHPDSLSHITYTFEYAQGINSSFSTLYTSSSIESFRWFVNKDSSEIFVLIQNLDSIKTMNNYGYYFSGKTVILKFMNSSTPVAYHDFEYGPQDGVFIEDIFAIEGFVNIAGNLFVNSSSIVLGNINYLFDNWIPNTQTGFTGYVTNSLFEEISHIAAKPTLEDNRSMEHKLDINMFPNPTKESVFLSFDNRIGIKNVTLSLCNIYGIELMRTNLEIPQGSFQKLFEFGNQFPAGVYLVKVIADSETLYSGKLIKNN